MKPGTQSRDTPDGVVVGFIKTVAHYTATPVLIWLVLSFLLGPIMAALKQGDEVEPLLRRSMAVERDWARLMQPGITIGGWEAIRPAWTWRMGENAVRWALGEEGVGYFVDDEQYAQDRRMVWKDQGAEAPAPEVVADGRNEAVRGFSAKLSTWLHDRFKPVQRAFWSIFISRALMVVDLLLVALPLAVVAWFYGEYLVRARVENGEQPLNHRYRAYVKLMRLTTVLIPVACALPFAWVPAPIVLPILVVLLLITIVLMRSHSVPTI